jgi:hypothetical protein
MASSISASAITESHPSLLPRRVASSRSDQLRLLTFSGGHSPLGSGGRLSNDSIADLEHGVEVVVLVRGADRDAIDRGGCTGLRRWYSP